MHSRISRFAMASMPQEQVLSRLGGCTLSTHRVRHETQALGYGKTVSIMLEEVASCMVTRTSHPLLLFLGVLGMLAAGGLAASSPQDHAAAIAVAALSLLPILGYFLTRALVVAVASAGATIYVPVAKAGPDAAKRFIDSIEVAKNHRHLLNSPYQTLADRYAASSHESALHEMTVTE
jgi:hypothetical protein